VVRRMVPPRPINVPPRNGRSTKWIIGSMLCTQRPVIILCTPLLTFCLRAAASAQSGWPYSLAGKPRGSAPDIQSLMLAHAGNEGAEKCGSINVPKCSGTGYSYDLCKQQPEAHFVLWAIDNWANYLSAVQAEFNGATISLTALTSTLVKQFYTPQTDPTKLLVPVGIVSGIASGLSGFFGPAALIAGAGSIVSSILLQASLDKVE
jgi:hypothetical protein